MMPRKPGGGQPRPVKEAWGAISAFEEILQAVPDDCGAMDALVQSYELVGDRARAREYLIRLVQTYLRSGRQKDAVDQMDRLIQYYDGEAEIAALIEELHALAPAEPPPRPAEEAVADTAGPDRQNALQAELALAWKLHEQRLLTQDEYASIVQDLSEISSRPVDTTVSVLHALLDRHFGNFDGIMSAVARESGLPILPLNSFDTPRATAALLPLAYMKRRGVAVFETISNEALVAVMNPFDEDLQRDAARLLGRPCRFFLTLPTELDAWLARVEKTQTS